jgi:hypothetical protein
MATRKPARVLPDPVGAAIRVSRPEVIKGQPRACGSVGPSGKRRRNQVATAGWKVASTGCDAVGPRSGAEASGVGAARTMLLMVGTGCDNQGPAGEGASVHRQLCPGDASGAVRALAP